MYTDETVDLYELEHAGFREDLHLFSSYAMLTGGPLLELGCGTGRLMLPLVQAGYEVVGVDASPAMLARARAKLSAVPADRWRLVEANLAQLGGLPSEHVGLAYCALNTWAHVTDPNEALRILRAVHPLLRPAGLLVIDLEDTERRPPGRGELLLAGTFGEGEDIVVKTTATTHDPCAGVDDVTVLWDRVEQGAVRRTVARSRMRPYTRGEMEQLLARAGYSIREVIGSWDLEVYAGRGDRLIFVASNV